MTNAKRCEDGPSFDFDFDFFPIAFSSDVDLVFHIPTDNEITFNYIEDDLFKLNINELIDNTISDKTFDNEELLNLKKCLEIQLAKINKALNNNF